VNKVDAQQTLLLPHFCPVYSVAVGQSFFRFSHVLTHATLAGDDIDTTSGHASADVLSNVVLGIWKGGADNLALFLPVPQGGYAAAAVAVV
jgi:hypothetical protein